MQIRGIFGIAAMLMMPVVSPSAYASGWRYDPILEPLPAASVPVLIKQHSRDLPGLVLVLQRAVSSYQIASAYRTMDDLAAKEPGNGCVLQAYCLVFAAANGYPPFTLFRNPNITFTSADYRIFRQRMDASYHVDANPWVALLIDGELLCLQSSKSEGLAKIKKAIAIAPDSAFAHYVLARALCAYTDKLPRPTKDEYRIAAAEAKRSLELDHTFSKAAWLLFMIYAFDLPDRDQALHWEDVSLSLAPPGSDVDKRSRTLIERFNYPLPGDPASTTPPEGPAAGRSPGGKP